jgi:transcriptional regulator with XRE-family HTH domain
MATLQTSILSKPTGADKVPTSTFVYLRARLKHRIYSLIIGEFKKSGLSQADLARRLDKEPAHLSRLLSGPGNLTIETISDLLFGISGTELDVSSNSPVRAKNQETRVEPPKKSPATPPLTPTPRSSEPFNLEIIWKKHPQERANTPAPIPEMAA